MNKIQKIYDTMKCSSLVIMLTCLVTGVTIQSCQPKNNTAETHKKSGPDSVTVLILKKDTVNKQIVFPAELVPLERADLFAKVSGYVGAIKVDIGDRVNKGQTLVVLEAPEVVANDAQAGSDVQNARSRYIGSLDTYKRMFNASKTEGTVAALELEKARSQMLADSAFLDASRAKKNSYAQLKDYLVIRAPFSGVITQRNIDPGTLVNTNAVKPMLVLENTSELRLRVPVPEAYAATSARAESVDFTVEAQPDITYHANLSRKAGALNQANRTETWEFLYQNTNGQLKSGMYANAVLKLGRAMPTFLVPSPVVATNLEKKFVIRLKNGKAEWIDVRGGISMGDKLEIFGLLNIGDTLVARATDEIKAGTALLPRLSH